MKNSSIKLLMWMLIGFFPLLVNAQNAERITMAGIVYGANKTPLKGAMISSPSETDNETVTDETGYFSIQIPMNATLAITAKGYATMYIKASVSFTEATLDVENSDSDVPVAFRTVKKRDLVGGVSVVDMKEQLKKSYTTFSLDGMEALAPGYNGNSIWGMGSYMLMIDGVPRNAGNVMPTEIDQITFLKGAAAVALYGSRAAKGVINITTKRGATENQRFDLRINTGVHVPKSYPQYLGSAEYMTLYNEARRNDGLTNFFSEESIYHHSTGENVYRYPNVDYYSSEYLKSMYNRTDVTAEISGGNERARYYTNFGYQRTGGLLNFGEAVDNNFSDRFNMRGNIDININQYITANVDASAIFNSGRGVNTNYWNGAATLRPYRFSPLLPISMIEPEDSASQVLVNNANLIDGQYLLGGTQLDPTNPFGSIYAGGTNSTNSRQFQFNTGIHADLRNVLKGLSFHTGFGVDYSIAYTLAFNNEYATYGATWNNYAGVDLISSLTKFNQDATNGQQNVSGNVYNQTVAANAHFDYQTTIQNKHNINAMFIVNGFQQSQSAVYHRVSNANLGFHTSYNYDHKYYFDFSGALMHSARLPEKNRQNFSPTVSLGWRLSEEKFLEDASFIDDLKLTASAGIIYTDLDINDYYLYQGFYTAQGAWHGWKDGVGIQSTESRRGDNPYMTAPRREEITVGLEGSFFNRALQVNGTFFANKISGNIIQASVIFPSYFTTGWPVSSFIPFVNYNDDKRIGFDFGANYNKRIGAIDWSFGVTATYYNTQATKRAELWENDYQNRLNKPLDAMWGLQNDGFFSDQADIDNSPTQAFGQVRPGDIKYKDQNADGIIDGRDEVFLSKGGWFGAPLTTGINITAKWKNLTVFALGVGRFGGNAMRNNSYFWMDGEDKYSVVARNRWTENTKTTATYPRLTTFNSDNNYRSSDFWLYSTNRFDLGNLQITYNLKSLVKKSNFMKELSVYLSGYNLLTIAPEREILEMNIGTTPQTRLFNFGLTTLF
jgi:TonB-linked SusC/RagA family outer membrane protein